MGFRAGTYLTVWGDGNNFGGNYECKQVSANRKNRETGEYETSFRGFVRFVGSAADVIRDVPVRGRVKVGDCDVTSYYKKDTNTTTFTFTVFSCEKVGDEKESSQKGSGNAAAKPAPRTEPEPVESSDDDDLPF